MAEKVLANLSNTTLNEPTSVHTKELVIHIFNMYFLCFDIKIKRELRKNIPNVKLRQIFSGSHLAIKYFAIYMTPL